MRTVIATMALPVSTLIPLGSGAIYAIAALFLKRATEGGSGPWRTAFVTNWVQALVFAPFWLLGGQPNLPREYSTEWSTRANMSKASSCGTSPILRRTRRQ